MTWSGFRPSDDGNTYGYPIPANMYAAAGLERALELNRLIWQSPEFEQKASKLLAGIHSGECAPADQSVAPACCSRRLAEAQALWGQLRRCRHPPAPCPCPPFSPPLQASRSTGCGRLSLGSRCMPTRWMGWATSSPTLMTQTVSWAGLGGWLWAARHAAAMACPACGSWQLVGYRASKAC